MNIGAVDGWKRRRVDGEELRQVGAAEEDRVEPFAFAQLEADAIETCSIRRRHVTVQREREIDLLNFGDLLGRWPHDVDAAKGAVEVRFNDESRAEYCNAPRRFLQLGRGRVEETEDRKRRPSHERLDTYVRRCGRNGRVTNPFTGSPLDESAQVRRQALRIAGLYEWDDLANVRVNHD